MLVMGSVSADPLNQNYLVDDMLSQLLLQLNPDVVVLPSDQNALQTAIEAFKHNVSPQLQLELEKKKWCGLGLNLLLQHLWVQFCQANPSKRFSQHLE